MMELIYWGMEVFILGYALRGRREALIALAFSLPISRRLPALPVPLLNFQNLLVIICLLAFVIHKPGPEDRKTRIKYFLPLGLLMTFFTIAWITTLTYEPELFGRFWSNYRNAVLFRSFMLSLSLYIMGSLLVRNRKNYEAVVMAGLGGIIFEALYALTEYVLLRPGRVTGHLDEPNSAGAFFAAGFVILAAMALILPRSHRYWKHSAAGSLLCCVAMAGTLSRGAFLASMIGFGMLTFFVNKRIFAALAIIIVLSPVWLPQSIKARMEETVTTKENLKYRFREGEAENTSALLAAINEQMDANSGDARLDSSSQARILVWSIAFEMMLDRPLGSGFGVFPWEVHYYTESMWFKATHNIYLKIGSEDGVQALLSFIALLVCLCLGSLKIWRSSLTIESSALGAGMLFSTFSLMFNALFVDLFFQLESTGTYWFLMGALMQAPILLTGERDEPVPAGEEQTATPRKGRKPLYELV